MPSKGQDPDGISQSLPIVQIHQNLGRGDGLGEHSHWWISKNEDSKLEPANDFFPIIDREWRVSTIGCDLVDTFFASGGAEFDIPKCP